jgi:hypothetical protein
MASEAFHAEIYLVAHKYEMPELADLAVRELDEELSWTGDSFLPSLAHLLVPSITLESIDAKTSIVAPGRPKRVITEHQDPKMWEMLAARACADFHQDKHDDEYRDVMMASPAFQWEVMGRLAKQLEETQAKLDKVNSSIEVPKPKPKRKRVAKTQNTKTEGKPQVKAPRRPSATAEKKV